MATKQKAMKKTPAEMLTSASRAIMPETALEARNVLSDVADIIKRLRTLHLSGAASLTLPDGVDADLLAAQQSVFAALRKLEA